MLVKLAEVLREIDRNHGRVFSVDFIKRSTGEVRTITCRQGVHKYLKGVGATYNSGQRGLLRVVDMALIARGDTSPYRSIPIEGIRRVRIGKRLLEVYRGED
jgi:hypothetical protein